MKQSPLITLRQVGKVYQEGRLRTVALRPTTLMINRGDFCSIMGPSGSGKSTLMHLIGLLDRPTSGKITVDTQPIIASVGDAELSRIRREQIGFIFQTFNLLPLMTALDNVMLPLIYSRYPNRQQRAKELLELVDLEHRFYHKASELSGGERQRVAIARALANDPELILADEPTGNLDSKSGKIVLGLLTSLVAQGKTVVLVTHDPHVGRLAKRQLIMKDGRLIA